MRRFATVIETVPTPCRVFGTALRPFCLGHHLLFCRLALPFADNPDAECNPAQLLEAVFVCAHSYEDNLAGQHDGTWIKASEDWMRRVRRSKPDVLAALTTFRRHLEEGYRIAPVWRSGKQGVTLSAPWEQLLKCRLVSSGFTLAEVMNGYLPAAWYDYFTLLEIAQAGACADPSKWQPVFYTLKDALADEQANTPPRAPEATP